MHLRKFVASLVLIAVLMMGLATVSAAATEEDPAELQEAPDLLAVEEDGPAEYFVSFTATVQEIDEYSPVEGGLFLWTESEDGPINVVITEETYVLNADQLEAGAVVTCFYDATLPVILIYPPQYRAVALIVGDIESQVKADLFDEELVSSDNTLKLNNVEEAEVLWPDGTAFDGDLAGHKLFVLYGASTKSIPAQTNPDKIIVLDEKEEAVEEPEATEEPEQPEVPVNPWDIIDFDTVQTVVENQIIEAPAPYVTDDGVIMAPLRAIAEALGYSVGWDHETQTVTLASGITLTIDQNKYLHPLTGPAELGAAPTLRDGRTYVPLAYFKTVLGLNNAYVFEGQLVVDDQEEMH